VQDQNIQNMNTASVTEKGKVWNISFC